MRSPEDMQIILIDVTNACTERCSNCTRFCGNHKKPFFMTYETFKRGVDSMEGFGGLFALIGGEPTLIGRSTEGFHPGAIASGVRKPPSCHAGGRAENFRARRLRHVLEYEPDVSQAS